MSGAPTAPDAPDGVRTLEPQDTAATDDAPPQDGRFRFAGEEFDTQAAAEQNFRTLRGQFKPVMGLAKQLGGLDRIGPTLETAARSAREWKAEAEARESLVENLRAEIQALRAGKAPAATPDVQPDATNAPADEASVDWELYAEIKRLATESGQPWKAEQWLMEQVQTAERTRFERMLDERLRPWEDASEKAAVASHTEALFANLAEYVRADGSPAFPELRDETAAYEIGRLWASLGLPREHALTPQGAAAAIALYRDKVRARDARNSGTARPQGQPPVPAAPPMAPSHGVDTHAAADFSDGRPTVASMPGAGGPSAEAARILAGLREVNNTSTSRAILGFDA